MHEPHHASAIILAVSVEQISTIVTVAVAAAAAGAVLFRSGWSVPGASFFGGMVLLIVDSLLGYFAGVATNADAAHSLLRWQIIVLSAAPAVWLLFAGTYSRGDYLTSLRRRSAVLGALFLAGPAAALFFFDSLLADSGIDGARLGVAGCAVHMLLIVASTVVLMNLEKTFRASVGVMRWQIKFMVVGLAALFLTRVYTSTQSLLYRGFNPSWNLFNDLALLVASAMTFVSLKRGKSFSLDLYPSSTLVYQSLTVLLVGAYLLAVGFLANAAKMLGSASAFPLQALLVLLALVGIGLLLLSDRARLKAKRFLSRNLRRPVHDFRKIWTAFSAGTLGHVDEAALCRATVKLIAETFDVLSVTIWLVPQTGRGLYFGASTSLTEEKAKELLQADEPIDDSLQKLSAADFPVDIDASSDGWVQPLKQFQPIQFAHGGHRFCVPAVADKELTAVIIVGDRVGKVPLSMEDLDLLKCIADQLARDLVRIRLSQRLAEAKEMQAFQTMATFFVHDLKNTAWTLSLLVENLRHHFDRPEFREDAVRAVSKSVARINDVISRLGSLRQEFQLTRVPTSLNELVDAALKDFEGLTDVTLSKTLRPVSNALLDVEQMKKVVVNLVLNAKEAVKPGGRIQVETEQQDGSAVLMVSDDGCGMTPEFLRQQLFRPFQTTKKKGIGIGMFQSKMIVEAHAGKVLVESTLGKGTTFRIVLPVQGGQP